MSVLGVDIVRLNKNGFAISVEDVDNDLPSVFSAEIEAVLMKWQMSSLH